MSNTVLLDIEIAGERLKKICVLWKSRDENEQGVFRVFGVLSGPGGDLYVSYSPNMPAIVGPLYVLQIDEFIAKFEPSVK